MAQQVPNGVAAVASATTIAALQAGEVHSASTCPLCAIALLVIALSLQLTLLSALLQLVASDVGPTVLGVTKDNLQQYLYELCAAVVRVIAPPPPPCAPLTRPLSTCPRSMPADESCYVIVSKSARPAPLPAEE